MVFIPRRPMTGLSKNGLPKKPKYGNKKVEADGLKFDSIIERDRYYFLKAAEREGKIRNLKCQVRFDCVVNKEKICTYVADFTYQKIFSTSPWLTDVVEDVKGMVTPMFKIKAKLMKACHNIEILIVKSPSLPI